MLRIKHCIAEWDNHFWGGFLSLHLPKDNYWVEKQKRSKKKKRWRISSSSWWARLKTLIYLRFELYLDCSPQIRLERWNEQNYSDSLMKSINGGAEAQFFDFLPYPKRLHIPIAKLVHGSVQRIIVCYGLLCFKAQEKRIWLICFYLVLFFHHNKTHTLIQVS